MQLPMSQIISSGLRPKLVLSFVIISILICASNDVLSQTPEFQTGHDINSAKASEEKTLIGQRLWFVPNLKGMLRHGFAKSTEHRDLVLSERLYPNGTVTLQVVEKIPRSASTGFQEFYRVQFDNGSSAYIEAITIEIALSEYTSNSITEENVDLARSDLFDTYNLGSSFSEKFFKEDPTKLKNKIAVIDKVTKKAEAERQARGGVRIGMTEAEVLASSWGKPNEINRTDVKGIISEQWVYSGQNYLYFTNGKLSGIQTNKK